MPKKSRGPHLKWRKDKGAWYIYAYKNGREQCRSTSTDDHTEAQKALAAFIIESSRPDGRHTPAERAIADSLADYADERGVNLKSQKTFTTCLERLNEFWGKKAASAVNENNCREYHTHRNKQFRSRPKAKWLYPDQNMRSVSPSQISRELSVLQAALNHDWKKGRLDQYVHVWKPKFDNRKDRWLTRQEAAALLRAARAKPEARKYLPLFIILGLYTGARHSAILGLTWDRVDVKAGLIDFNEPGLETTKKGRSLQKMPRRLQTFMKRPGKGFIIQRGGKPLLSVKKAFGEACREAGLVGVSPHTLRHTAASWMAQKGVPFAVMARYLGHTDSRTTERIYSHHAPDYLQEAADSFDTRPITRPKKQNKIRKTRKRAKNKGKLGGPDRT